MNRQRVIASACTALAIARLLFACLFVTAALSCAGAAPATRPAEPAPKWTGIAGIGGIDSITQTHVGALLKSHGIDSIIEGSVIYGVAVHEEDADRAIAILRDDLKTRHYDVTLWEGKISETYSVADTDWVTDKPGKLYQDVLRLERYRADADLGAVLRHDAIKTAVLAFPWIVEIKSHRRQYIDREAHLGQIGHDVEIRLTARIDEEIGGKRMWFQVWENGSQIESQGSNEWWKGEPDVIAANKKRYDHRPE